MKHTSALLLCIIAFPSYSGEMGDQSTSTNQNFISISGGYHSGHYQSNYTKYTSGVLYEQSSFDDKHTNGYEQLALGRGAHFGSLSFDHQIALSKLNGSESFYTHRSKWAFSQTVDFGYDWMPKLNVFRQLEAFGILGVHYARFYYKKHQLYSSLPTATFDVHKDQIGFNLGAGFYYHVSPSILLGIKYQHWQYQAAQVDGYNYYISSIARENITPTFNLAGVELRYYWN